MGACPGGRVMRKWTGVDLKAIELVVDIVEHAEAK